jgi:hypothetical protein
MGKQSAVAYLKLLLPRHSSARRAEEHYAKPWPEQTLLEPKQQPRSYLTQVILLGSNDLSDILQTSS